MANSTPGRVAFETWKATIYPPLPYDWDQMPNSGCDGWETIAATVINHVVGPSSVVVQRADAFIAAAVLTLRGYTSTAHNLREALR